MPAHDRIAELEQRLDDLTDTVDRLQDREAVRELCYDYCYTVDSGDWDAFIDLFTEDAHVEYRREGHGTYEGHAGLREFVKVAKDDRGFMVHMIHNPVVTMNGDESKAYCYFEIPVVDADGEALWLQGRYDLGCRRVDGTWKIARHVATYNYVAPYEHGWADEVDA